MGTLAYGSPQHVCTIDDRILRHAQIVIFDKLRRGERFTFSFDDAGGGPSTSLWMSPEIPLHFQIGEPADATVNPAWLTAISRTAHMSGGLRIVAEPDVSTPQKAPQPQPQRELVGAPA